MAVTSGCSSFSCSTKMASFCFTLLGFAMAIGRVHCQSTEALGFISIDCGIPENTTYVDDTNNITYIDDFKFIDTGIIANISSPYVSGVGRRYLNVRSFPNGTRNCFTVKPITAGSKYLVRATFMYGNYDGLNSAPMFFDLYLGVNLWRTVNISSAGSGHQTEVITVIPADYVQVCLVNIGQGTPFISGLDLRPLKDILYPMVNESLGLVNYNRLNVGPTDNNVIRYPDDPHDRFWFSFSNVPYWNEVSTVANVRQNSIDHFEVPSAVLQTAVVPANKNNPLEITWTPDPAELDEFYLVLHFSEIQILTGRKSLRQFNMYINDILWDSLPFTPQFLFADAIYSTSPTSYLFSINYDMKLEATDISDLPPIINAMEIFTPLRNDNVSVNSGDFDAMMAIRAWYQIKSNWMGDPCSPEMYAWDGLNCTYGPSDLPRVISLNLSFSGLTGEISTYFCNLSAIQYLDLSYNNLTGTIPAALAELPSLKLLDLAHNQLNGSVPASLLKKSQDGLLTLRIEGNPNLCANDTCKPTNSTDSTPVGGIGTPMAGLPVKKKTPPLFVAVGGGVAALVLLVAVFIYCRTRKRKGFGIGSYVKPQNDDFSGHGKQNQEDSIQLENRQFTYMELKKITNNFERELGKGGFGRVYHGCLEDGSEVAVKTQIQTSSQGAKEFLSEAQHLTRIHHRNLVSMVGYCKDNDYVALVYEYMSQGTLQEHLRGKKNNARGLSWRQRLQIAVESAQGLEYLHKGCQPPLIHRDVKTANILLTGRLQAKIADFGLSKAFLNDNVTHVSTKVVGTPGYLDPEYYSTYQISEKSDVYSFGVVLLELITGQPPIIPPPENAHVVHWVRQRLGKGNIEDVIDPRMHGQYDVNSVWKCADLAMKSTAQGSQQRPTMAEVVVQLKESLELETSIDDATNNLHASSENMPYTDFNEVSHNSAFEMDHAARMSVGSGPAAR